MGKIKVNYLIYLFIGISILIISVSVYKAEKKHKERLMYVINTKIKEAAKLCYLKEDGKDEITLQDLYDKKYLEELVNPVTKEIIDSSMCISYVDEEVKLC